MKKNIGMLDRILRFVIGISFVANVIIYERGVFVESLFVLLALFAFYEAFASWCLFYRLIGRNTCPIGK